MNLEVFKYAPRFASKNRNALTDACCCYYCLKTFPSSQIKEWIDSGQTALCPECGVDSVVSAELVPDQGFLELVHEYWFDAAKPICCTTCKNIMDVKSTYVRGDMKIHCRCGQFLCLVHEAMTPEELAKLRQQLERAAAY